MKSSYLNIPVALEVPKQLAFIRTNFLAIITQNDIKRAGLRITEAIAKKPILNSKEKVFKAIENF